MPIKTWILPSQDADARRGRFEQSASINITNTNSEKQAILHNILTHSPLTQFSS
jgi:hypothetical protein